jgi:beta-glucosidase
MMIAYQQKLKLSVVAVAVSIGLAGTLAGCNDDDNNTSQVQDEDAQYRANAEALFHLRVGEYFHAAK